MPVDVLHAVPADPAAVAIVAPERTWRYGELDAAVDAEARALTGGGLAPGAVVPVTVRADVEGVVALLAHWRAGAVPAPLNERLTDAERTAATDALRGAPLETQVIVWTSGTSGRPRGVALSFDNVSASVRAAEERLGLGSTDVWLASLSPAHVGGLVLVVRSLLLGGTLVTAGAFDAGLASDLLDGRGPGATEGTRVTHLSLVPTQLLRLLDERAGRPPPEGFGCALVGGAHAPAEIVERALAAGWPLALTYGATEMCSQIATATPEETRLRPGTVGAPLVGVEVETAPDGELLTRGPTRALGYVGVGEEPGSVRELVDADGWYHTGDLGRVDEDGLLRVTGRRADRIVSGGVTIDAVEVEEVLRSHPAVLDACVVGVPDVEWGEVVTAWIDPVVGEFEEEDVARHVAERLSGAKVPRRFHLGGPLPLNPNGKVDRVTVRAALTGR